MDEHTVDILPGEILRWVREDAAGGTPRLWVRASKTYEGESAVAEESDLTAEDDLSRVVVNGLLEVSPQPGSGWTLQVRAEASVGLKSDAEDESYEDEDDLTVDAFEAQFLVPERGEVEIVVLADDAAAWRRFQQWLAKRRAQI